MIVFTSIYIVISVLQIAKANLADLRIRYLKKQQKRMIRKAMRDKLKSKAAVKSRAAEESKSAEKMEEK